MIFFLSHEKKDEKKNNVCYLMFWRKGHRVLYILFQKITLRTTKEENMWCLQNYSEKSSAPDIMPALWVKSLLVEKSLKMPTGYHNSPSFVPPEKAIKGIRTSPPFDAILECAHTAWLWVCPEFSRALLGQIQNKDQATKEKMTPSQRLRVMWVKPEYFYTVLETE